MTDKSKYDIHIGETERIKWKDFDEKSNEHFEVDYVLDNYPDFWNYLELFCVADCCGLDAFRFYPADIIKASNEVDKVSLKEDLVKLKIDLDKSDKSIIISSRLNNLVDKSVFIELLNHIIKYL